MRKPFPTSIFLLLLLIPVLSLNAQVPSVVANLGTFDKPSGERFEYNGRVIYQMDGYPTFNESLWISDGTTNGTRILGNFTAEIEYLHLIPGSSRAFFIAYTPGGQTDLWRTDGTVNGTVLMASLEDDALTVPPLSHNGKTYYATSGPGSGDAQLWVSDGSAVGTVKLKSFLSEIQYFHTLPGRSELYFLAEGNNGQWDLWKTNGTPGGTVSVFNFGVRDEFSAPVAIAGTTYYATLGMAQDTSQLWRTDGTATGTTLIAEIPGTLKTFHQISGQTGIYFFAQRSSGASLLWKTDGTPAGTATIKFFNAQSELPPPIEIGGKTFYTPIGDDPFESDLWVTDGTNGGTYQIRTFNGFTSQYHELPGQQGVYFLYENANSAVALLRINPTATTTTNIQSFGLMEAYEYLQDLNGEGLYLLSPPGPDNAEIWTSNGTAAGTQKIKDIVGEILFPHTFPGAPEVFFLSFASNGQTEFWKTNGTDSTTVVVRTLGVTGGVEDMIFHNGQAWYNLVGVFFADAELWRSDGTLNGTTIVKEHQADMREFHVIGNTRDLYYLTIAPGDVFDLWQLNDPAPVGMSEFTKEEQVVSVYPNPSQGHFWAKLKGLEPDTRVETTLVDLQGNEVWQQILFAGDRIPIHLPETLAPGAYLIQFATNDQFWVEKIMLF